MGVFFVAALLALGWVLPVRALAAPVEVTTCGQGFSGGGFLSGDLDCSGFPGFALLTTGTLDLRGFTLTAGDVGLGCGKSCKIVSDPPGGTITSDGLTTIVAVFGSGGGRGVNVRISNVVINDGIIDTDGNIKLIDSTVTGVVDNSNAAVKAVTGTARLLRSVVTANAGDGVLSSKTKIIDSEVTNNGELGVFGTSAVVIKRSTISGNGFHGVRTNDKRVRVTDSTITGNGQSGIYMPTFFDSKVKVIRSDVSGNIEQGISGVADSIVVRDSTITNNGAEGIEQADDGDIKVVNSTVASNALDGIAQIDTNTLCRLTVRGSTVTGNGTDADCGVSRTCADLSSCAPPEVSSTSCDTSYDVNSGFPGASWGVCSLD